MSKSRLDSVLKNKASYKAPKNGAMTGEYLKDYADAFRVSLLGHHHMYFMAPPGCGKTTAMMDFADRYAPGQNFMVRVTPEMSEAPFAGYQSIKSRMEDKNEIIFTNTPYDPNMLIVIADELPRANEPTLQALIHATDPKKQSHCLVWATANTALDSEILEALNDRFGVIYFMEQADFDTLHLGLALFSDNGKLTMPYWCPSQDDIALIRSQVPTEKAVKAMADVIERIRRDLATSGSFDQTKTNHRLITQMYQTLFYSSVFFTGTNDFDQVPYHAIMDLRFTYSSVTIEEFTAWGKLVTAVAAVQGKGQAEVEFLRIMETYRPRFLKAVEDCKPGHEGMTARANEYNKLREELFGNESAPGPVNEYKKRFGADSRSSATLEEAIRRALFALMQGSKKDIEQAMSL